MNLAINNKSQNHRITESSRLEETSKITESNLGPNTNKSSTKPYH